MAKYRKKPVVIEAMRLPQRDEDPSPELIEWLHAEADWDSGNDGTLVIYTLEGDMTAQPGDWIIKGIKGELYPCKADIFDATYELVDE